MPEPNWTNRTMWTRDNLEVMRGMNSESVDLIYLDPPFNSNRTYEAPIGSKAAGAAFKDTWTLSDLDVAWHGYLADKEPALYAAIDAAGHTHGKSMKSYLIMMGIRLIEMKRILKSTGSIYLHCDPTASHYLKTVMDAVFGRENFKNEIVWSYRRYTAASKRFQREHDVILFYGGGKHHRFNTIYDPYGKESGKRDSHYKLGDDGRWFRWQKRRGKEPYKVYLSDKGRRTGDVWQISHINASAKERIGYPTQKPLSLLERIIEASSNKGDLVFDPFAGCATACVAAEMLGRKWIGIDISSKASDLVRIRIEQMIDLFGDKIIRRKDIPRRTDVKTVQKYGTYKHDLYGQQEGYCNGCKTHFPFRNLTVDHKTPQSKGGTDHVENLQLLCGSCNSVKGDRDMPYLMAALQQQDTKVSVSATRISQM